MNLLKKYKSLELEYNKAKGELKLLKIKKDRIENELEAYVVSKKIYLPYEEIVKYLTLYKDQDIDFQLIAAYSKDGYMRTLSYKEALKNDLKVLHPIGGYNIKVNGELIKETSLDYLWEKKNV